MKILKSVLHWRDVSWIPKRQVVLDFNFRHTTTLIGSPN